MKIKVCGMTYRQNLEQVAELKPDFLGFIFYPPSPRYMRDTLSPEDVRSIDKNIDKVGVFVNSPVNEILDTCGEYGLGYAQLHGSESVADCLAAEAAGIRVIKVFGVKDDIDWAVIEAYEAVCTALLFDTKTERHGGSGKAFDWALLEGKRPHLPYFLSGGISREGIDRIIENRQLQPYALDLNSRFEDTPGMKNIELIKQTISKVRHAISG